MATHKLSKPHEQRHRHSCCKSPAWDLSPQKAVKPKARGPWYAVKQLQFFHTHLAWHIWRGPWASRASEGSGNKQWKAQALFCKADISYHYPPCPRQTLPVHWKPPGRETRHRPPAPSRSPAGPPRSWAGRGRAAAISRDLPACPAAPIPPTRPPQSQHNAGSIPVFIQHKHQRSCVGFFCSKQSSKGLETTCT